MKKQRTFYVKDMILYICRKWRVVVMWMIAFAILFDGYSVFKSYKNVSDIQKDQSSENEMLESFTSELSDNDIKKVEETYDIYLTYKQSLDYTLDYYNNSVKMKINPHKVPTVCIQYKINGVKDISDIVVAFENKVKSKESCDEIKTSLKFDESDQYLCELIQIDLNQKGTQSDVLSIQDDTMISNEKSNTMIVKVIASDKKMCETIANVVEEEIQLNTQEIQNSLGDFELTQVDRNYFENVDDELLGIQQDYAIKLNSIKVSIENLMTSLDDNQKNYYKALINQEEEEKEETAEMTTQKVSLINVKYIIVGLFIGGFLSCAWYFVIYIFNKNLLVGRELEEYYNLQLLESFNGNTIKRKQFFVDKILNRVFNVEDDGDEENKIQMICSNIMIAAQRKNMKKLYITSVSSSEEIEKIENQIINWFKNTSIEMERGDSILVNSKSLNDLASSNGVIFVEQVGKSDFFGIGKEVHFCKANDVNIIGAIAIN